jgi:hypothetical protein
VRSPVNGIKIIPKAGSFAIRIPASKPLARPVVREPSESRRSVRRQLSSPRPDPAPPNVTGTRTTAHNGREATGGHNLSSSAPGAITDNDLSPAEVAKLKKIKALILAKGEDELLRFLRS